MSRTIRCALSVALPLALWGCSQPAPPPAKAPIIASPALSGAPKVKVETLAEKKDIVCRMDLEPEVEFTVKHDGKTYGFCSSYCKSEFEKDPNKYLNQTSTAPAQAMPGTPAAPASSAPSTSEPGKTK